MDAESVPAQAKQSKGKGTKAKAKSKSKPAPTDEVRIGDCDSFCQDHGVVLLPKQRGCESCYRDLETIRRDAKAAGPKAQKWLKQAEKKGNEEMLHEFWHNWAAVVGPRTGKPRTGIFPVTQYIYIYIYIICGAPVRKTE